MGLTIGYQLSARRPLKLAALPKLIAPLRDAAHDLGFERVGELIQIGPDYLGQFEQPRGMKKCQLADLLPPAEGWVFSAVPGDGSESVEIGLCRHEGLPGWRWRGGCKTQYASRHGWGHFRDCHRRVVDLLRACEKAGWRVKVMDEGKVLGNPFRNRPACQDWGIRPPGGRPRRRAQGRRRVCRRACSWVHLRRPAL